MIRFLLYLFMMVIAITVLRMVIGAILRGASVLMGGSSTRPSPQGKRSDVPAGGELKRDPVCGTFVSAATSIKRTIGSEIVHFCSIACRDKYHA